MLIHIKVLNNPTLPELQFEVTPSETIQQLKSRLSDRLQVPVTQQKLVLRGKPLHDGLLRDHQIADGCKLHLILSGAQQLATATAVTTKPINGAFIDELHSLASKCSSDTQQREAFVMAFQTEMKKTVDRLSLDDIEKLCTDRLNPTI